MRKIFFVLFFLSFHFAYAGTGSAKDVVFFYILIIISLAAILGAWLLGTYIRRIIRKHKQKSADQPGGEAEKNDTESQDLNM